MSSTHLSPYSKVYPTLSPEGGEALVEPKTPLFPFEDGGGLLGEDPVVEARCGHEETLVFDPEYLQVDRGRWCDKVLVPF